MDEQERDYLRQQIKELRASSSVSRFSAAPKSGSERLRWEELLRAGTIARRERSPRCDDSLGKERGG
jgi:hypothetical protein